MDVGARCAGLSILEICIYMQKSLEVTQAGVEEQKTSREEQFCGQK